VDHFARLGLPRRFGLDREAIEDAYLERAQAVHPDRFAAAPMARQREAMEKSSALNEGYRIVRDPLRRAEYLCSLAGAKDAPAMSQEFLIEMIERREAVGEARERGAAALDEVRGRVEDELEGVFDRAIDALEAGEIEAASRDLTTRRYLQRLLDEIDS